MKIKQKLFYELIMRRTSGIAAIGGVAESMDMKGMEPRSQSANCSLDEGTLKIKLN